MADQTIEDYLGMSTPIRMWVSGQVYNRYDVVRDPVKGQVYNRFSGSGGGTVSPSLDTANWASLTVTGAGGGGASTDIKRLIVGNVAAPGSGYFVNYGVGTPVVVEKCIISVSGSWGNGTVYAQPRVRFSDTSTLAITAPFTSNATAGEVSFFVTEYL